MAHRLFTTTLSLALVGCSTYNAPPEGQAGLWSSAAPVTIQRDAFGVPHVSASTDTAAFYGVR